MAQRHDVQLTPELVGRINAAATGAGVAPPPELDPILTPELIERANAAARVTVIPVAERKELAAAADVSPRTVQRWFTGKPGAEVRPLVLDDWEGRRLSELPAPALVRVELGLRLMGGIPQQAYLPPEAVGATLDTLPPELHHRALLGAALLGEITQTPTPFHGGKWRTYEEGGFRSLDDALERIALIRDLQAGSRYLQQYWRAMSLRQETTGNWSISMEYRSGIRSPKGKQRPEQPEDQDDLDDDD